MPRVRLTKLHIAPLKVHQMYQEEECAESLVATAVEKRFLSRNKVSVALGEGMKD